MTEIYGNKDKNISSRERSVGRENEWERKTEVRYEENQEEE